MTYADALKQASPGRPYRLTADWELRAMKKALTMLPMLNSAEENRRLADVVIELRARKSLEVRP